ncbi:hypothetical protein ASA1KI_43290 [Opitutales bacterium ASA1]|uniref:chorismate transformation enzyme, FkbO/Hyg5 family n=1 Tax=Congregicoccus parvus TaxID=3081749 RepID=UPI002B2ABB4E|nr:hypothetical protein ASA1KI_43290 [Opitutales bacterium ASA1]
MALAPAPVEAFPPLRHRLGGSDETNVDTIDLGVPVLHGPPLERLFSDSAPVVSPGPFRLRRSARHLIGAATVRLDTAAAAEPAARTIYRALLESIGEEHRLCRIWNYLPRINRLGADGLEVYQSFCRGRSLAFEHAWGSDFKTRLPAASAVGTLGADLVVLFAAFAGPVEHHENPRQTPAYEYPCQYGPRPPSFARASVCGSRGDPAGRDLFVSGTSAVIGHLSVAVGDTVAQTRCTIDNIRTVSRACGFGETCGIERATTAHAKIYLRHADEAPLVEPIVRDAFPQTRLHCHYVQADICRADLNVEIEVSSFGIAG